MNKKNTIKTEEIHIEKKTSEVRKLKQRARKRESFIFEWWKTLLYWQFINVSRKKEARCSLSWIPHVEQCVEIVFIFLSFFYFSIQSSVGYRNKTPYHVPIWCDSFLCHPPIITSIIISYYSLFRFFFSQCHLSSSHSFLWGTSMFVCLWTRNKKTVTYHSMSVTG